jgi:hypothetical protein
MMTPLIDPDDPSTWPTEVTRYVEESIPEARFDDHTDTPAVQWFFTTLSGPVKAYHCSRLLPHEEAIIREKGLVALNADALAARIEAARHFGEISAEEAPQLHGASVLREPHQQARIGTFHTFASALQFDTDRTLNYFLEQWGGEAIRRSATAATLPDRLMHLGRPSIIVLALDLSDPHEYNAWPGLLPTFTATLIQPDERGCTVVMKRDVRPEEVLTIWHPGDAQYDSFERLTRR